MITCGGCGASIFDNEVCICRKSKESNDMVFDPIKEVLILHEKIDKIGSDLQVLSSKMENLRNANLLHSEAFLKVAESMDLLVNAIEDLDAKKKNTD